MKRIEEFALKSASTYTLKGQVGPEALGAYTAGKHEGYIEGFCKAREMAEEYCREYRKAYDESIFPPVDMEKFDPNIRTAVAGRMGRFVLDNAIRDITQLGNDDVE